MKSLSGLSIKYMKHNISRTLMTMLGVMLSALLVYSIFSCSISVYNNSMKTDYEQSLGWDAMFVTDADTAARLLSHAQYYAEKGGSVMGITDSENSDLPAMTTGFMIGHIKSDGILYYVNDYNAMSVKISVKKGTYPSGSTGILVGEDMSKYNKLSVGSVYIADYLRSVEGSAFGERVERRVTVCGVMEQDFGMNYYNELPENAIYLDGYVCCSLMTEDIFNGIKTDENYSSYVSVYVTFSDKHDVRTQAKEIAEVFDLETSAWRVNESTLNYYHEENDTETLDYMFFKGLILLLGAMAGMSVIFIVRNSFNISVHERSQDYGILRCIGLTRKQIIRMILSEALITGIVGTFFGILVGHGFCSIAFWIIGKNFKYLGGYHLSTDALLWTGICMLIVTAYAMIAPVQQLYKLNPIEALRRIDEIESAEKALKHRKSRKKIGKSKEKNSDSKTAANPTNPEKEEKRNHKYEKRAAKLTKRFGVEAGYAYKNMMRTRKKFISTIVMLTIGGSIFFGGSILMKLTKTEILENTLVVGEYSGYFECNDEDELNTIKKDLSSLECVKKTKASSVNGFAWNKNGEGEMSYASKIYVVGLAALYLLHG